MSNKTLTEQKSELRAHMRQLLRGIPRAHYDSAGLDIAEHLKVLLKTAGSDAVAVFSNFANEFNTRPLIDWLNDNKIQTCFPSYSFDNPDLSFHPQSDIAFMLVPALAFDRFGNRLGRGKAYYDRYLRRFKQANLKAVTIAVGLDEQLLHSIPVETHDEAVHMICTPKLGLLGACRSN